MADKTFISVGPCEVKTAFDPKYKNLLHPVMAEAIKKAIEASGDFTTTNPHPGDKDAKSFTLSLSISVTKDDKSKPPKLKVIVDYALWLTGKGTSNQQAKGSSNAATEASSKIDEDVKLLVKDAIGDMAARDGKMLKAMRSFLNQ